eukprot:g42941.t1
MGPDAKTAKEELDVMSCPKFIKVGTQMHKAEAFAEYRMFSIGERKDAVGAAVCGMLNITEIPVILFGFKARGIHMGSDSEIGGQEERLERKSRCREEQNFFKVAMPRRDVS